MEFEGKITWVGKKIDGTSASTGKPWAMLQVEIEEVDKQYPQKLCATIFGEEKIASMMPTEAEVVSVQLNADCRRYTDKNGVERGSTDLRIWKMERIGGSAPVAESPVEQKQETTSNNDGGDLPF